jgi:hypothetical protein
MAGCHALRHRRPYEDVNLSYPTFDCITFSNMLFSHPAKLGMSAIGRLVASSGV